ncbi:MAG: sigma 54-interacting transcriptional regulator [Peptococcaceae bacterium]|jgi:transcriptional regulator with AAA-type ATPase domain/transcriptional regulatory protein LevR|nr:sigma 54-interacting transcriptional regulator [Peptococcaceae bacterium]
MRIDRIQEYVKVKITEQIESGQPVGVMAHDVSEALGIWRNDCAVELNKLVDQGKLRREGKKGVLFFPMDAAVDDGNEPMEIRRIERPRPAIGTERAKESSVFARLVGSNGSLKHQIRIAKAAVSYPPFGLNMLITGPSGSGKTMFAYSVWEYAGEIRAFGATSDAIPFVHFNCAEYADNPQLLVANLLGYKRGSFTGAVEDKRGLVEEANGGILLLDEIHCLSSTGQELFFTLLDTGYYRRLGDVTKRQSRFMLIGATTKPATDALLDTFLRRIPVLIQVPSLAERSINERKEFIEYFYRQETAAIQKLIVVKKDALNILAAYTSAVSLGTLKNVIQISCAKSLHRNISKNIERDEITITFGDILIQVAEHHIDTDKTACPFTSDLRISAKNDTGRESASALADIYEYVEEKIDSKTDEDLKSESFQQILAISVNDYFEDLKKMLVNTGIDYNLLDSVILPEIIPVAAKFLEMASNELDYAFSETAPLLLAMHISQYIDRMHSPMPLFPGDFRSLAQSNPRDFQFVSKYEEWLALSLGTEITGDELNFLAMFLYQGRKKTKNPGVWITLVSHNSQAAAALGNFFNTVLTPGLIHWVGGKSTDSMFNVFEMICDSVKMFHGAEGNLILTDIDMLTGLENEIRKASGVKCRIIPSLDHHLMICACKTTLTYDRPLDEIFQQVIESHCESLLYFFDIQKVNLPALLEKSRKTFLTKIILTVCVTGIGSAKRIKEILEQKLSYVPHLTIIAMSTLDDVFGKAAAYGDSLKLIVGTINLGIPNIPFLLSDKIFTANGMYYISTILNDWNYSFYQVNPDSADSADIPQESVLRDAFRYIAPNVEANGGVSGIFHLINILEQKVYTEPLSDELKMLIFMHTASMLERIVNGNALEMDDEAENLISGKKNWFSLLENIIGAVFNPYGYEIPREEIYYFMHSLPETKMRDRLNGKTRIGGN